MGRDHVAAGFRALIALLFVLSFGSAQASGLRKEKCPSRALGRDLPYWIYTPDGYDQSNLKYPVLYLLHGAGGDENAWVDHGKIKALADRMIGMGVMPPSLIVMPGCRGCWWVDGAKDKAETAFWKDLLPDVGRRYRVIEGRKGRVVAGLSAGGYGTIRFALKYPDRIAAAAALSPAVYHGVVPKDSSARTQPPFLNSRGEFDASAWWSQHYTRLSGSYFKQANKVPMYLVSGDDDHFGITFETVTLFKTLFEKQPGKVELRIVDGDHNWAVWENAIEGAMRYLYRHAAKPIPSGDGKGASRVAAYYYP